MLFSSGCVASIHDAAPAGDECPTRLASGLASGREQRVRLARVFDDSGEAFAVLSRQFAELQHVVVDEFNPDVFATHPMQHPFELRCRVLPVMSFPGRLADVLLVQRLKDRLPKLERTAIPVARDVRGVEQQQAAGSNRAIQRFEQKARCVRNVLDHRTCQHDIELAEAGDLFNSSSRLVETICTPLFAKSAVWPANAPP